MVKSFLVVLVGTLTAVLLLILPGLGLSVAALDLPDDLQDLLTQTASNLNFPYPGAVEKNAEDLEEGLESSQFDSPRFDNPRPDTARLDSAEGLRPGQALTQGPEVRKAAPVRPRLD